VFFSTALPWNLNSVGSGLTIATRPIPAPVNANAEPEPICGAGVILSAAEPSIVISVCCATRRTVASAAPVNAENVPVALWDREATIPALSVIVNSPPPI